MKQEMFEQVFNSCEKSIKKLIQKAIDEKNISDFEKLFYMLEGVTTVRSLFGYAEKLAEDVFKECLDKYLNSEEFSKLEKNHGNCHEER